MANRVRSLFWLANRTCLILVVSFSTRSGDAADPGRPLKYSTTWLGNSFGGGPKWVQNAVEDLCVLPDGTCVMASFWDEGGREVGMYRDGHPIAKLDHTHMRGGKVVAATTKYVFYAHTCAREDQPQVPAGEAPREKPICLFGVSRWDLAGNRTDSPLPAAGSGATPTATAALTRTNTRPPTDRRASSGPATSISAATSGKPDVRPASGVGSFWAWTNREIQSIVRSPTIGRCPLRSTICYEPNTIPKPTPCI